ncbi:MAG: 3-methyl-2-oxobutanoate hydroxymethyltransferase [Planctomycetota bacterium]
MKARTSICEFARWKAGGERFVCLTAYDAPTARILESSGVPMILVGDSVGNVVLGHADTVPVTVDVMVHHTAAVRRGAPHSFVVADMPFGSFQVSEEEAVRNAVRLVQEGGADAVKLEGGRESCAAIERIVAAGIPVVGHLGLTPQNATQLGGYRVQAADAASAIRLIREAALLEAAGAFAIVLECIPEQVAALVTERSTVPTIGIGAGSGVDAQVLVFHDLIGISSGYSPRFVRSYLDAEERLREAVGRFREDVSTGSFPGDGESFSMADEALAVLRQAMTTTSTEEVLKQ